MTLKSPKITFTFAFSILLSFIVMNTQTLSFAQSCCPGTPNLLQNYNSDFQDPIPPNGIPPGFLNDNNFVTNPTGGGAYLIVESRNYGACSGVNKQWDHTIGDVGGRFLWFDTPSWASATNPAIAWKPWNPSLPAGSQDLITVLPNTEYVFGVWVRDLGRNTNCTSGGAPLVGLRINGVDMIEIDLGNLTSPCCPEWIWLCTTWNSGNNTTALLYVESRRGTGFTDLGIDDLYFGLPLDTAPFLGADTSICLGDTLTYHTPYPNAITIWNDIDTNQQFNITHAGTYWAEIHVGNCIITDTIHISEGESPQFTLGEDTIICDGSFLTISPQSIPPGDIHFLWSDNSQDSFITVSQTGWVWLEMSNSCGTHRDSIYIEFSPSPIVQLPSDIKKCLLLEEQIEIHADIQPSNGVYNYLWSSTAPISNPNDSVLFFVADPGIYILRLKVTNQLGCVGKDSMTIEILNPIHIDVQPSSATINYGDSIQLLASGATNYVWTPDIWLDNSFIANPIAQPLENIVYTVKGSNSEGCKDSAQVKITLEYPYDIFIPNAFSPNSDGINDIFQIIGTGKWKLHDFNIYNRYGFLVFKTIDRKEGWDGTYKGKLADQGVYFYYIKIKLPNGELKEFKGDLTLFR